MAEAYAEDDISSEITLNGMWPKCHKLPNATERKFIEELFSRSRPLRKIGIGLSVNGVSYEYPMKPIGVK